jgi:hypothetical protein
MRTFALSLLLAAFLPPAGRGDPPFWPFPDFPARLLLSPPDTPLPTPFWVIPVHHADLSFSPAAFRLTPANAATPLPLRVVIQTPHQTVLLAHVSALSSRPQALHLYLSPTNLPLFPNTPPTAPEAPVLASFYPSRGRCFPENWPEILFFLQSRPTPFRVFSLPPLPAEIAREKRPAILALETFLAIPAAGTTRIRALGPHPTLGALDSTPLHEQTLEGSTTGPAVVRLRLFNGMADTSAAIGLEWQPPGSDRFAPIPAEFFLSYAMAIPTRLERLSRTLQPAFTAERFRPYGFHQHLPLFFPARFADESVNWLPHPYSREWQFPNNHRSSDSPAFFVFDSPGPHEVTLALMDELGFTATVSHTVSWSEFSPLYFPFSAIPGPLPSAAFRADWLEPTLLTRGAWPETLTLELESILFTTNGPPLRRSLLLQPSHFDRPIPLARCRAGELIRIEWAVRHHGTVVTNSLIRALHPPFPPHTCRVTADRLLDENSHSIVYVIPRLPPPLPSPPTNLRAPIRLLDDWLVHPSVPDAAATLPAILAERLKTPVSYHALRDQQTYALLWAPLAKFEEIPALAGTPPARLVLAIGGQDLEGGLSPDQFERQAAALSDRLLSDGFSVIWVTLPPFPERTEKARAYASALRRVAESRRLPIADLFTLFSGSEPDGTPLYSDLFPMALTAVGRLMAANAIADRLESATLPPSPAP